jgi:hypothetical protein
MRSPRTSLAAVAIAAALAFALAGCFSASPSAPTAEASASPATSVEPATGELVTGTGYSVHAPEGWTAPPEAASKADIFVAGKVADADGFVDTINVLLGPATGMTLAETEKSGAAHLVQAFNATKVKVRPRVAIAGSESAHLSLHLINNGFSGWAEQYLLTHAGTVYTISFTFRETVPREDREALAESVLATWTWA